MVEECDPITPPYDYGFLAIIIIIVAGSTGLIGLFILLLLKVSRYKRLIEDGVEIATEAVEEESGANRPILRGQEMVHF